MLCNIINNTSSQMKLLATSITKINNPLTKTQSAITCSKLIIETLERGVKYV